MSNSLKYLFTLIIGIILGLILYIPACSKHEEVPVKVEYIEVHDTVKITLNRIIPKTKIDYILRVDTFYIPFTDTVYILDLPISYKTYTDTVKTDSGSTQLSISYHGFNSGIDNVDIITTYYNTKEYIPEKSKKIQWTWCIGPYAGFGGNANVVGTKSIGAGPSAGICFSIGIGGSLK